MKDRILRFYPLINWPFRKVFKRNLNVTTFFQFTKHYFVGLMGSLLNFTLFNVLKLAGLATSTANIINACVVITIIFFVQKFFTYKPDHHSLRQPALFLLNSVVYFFLDTCILVFLIDRLRVVPLAAKLISIIILSPMSFLFQKFIVFKNKGAANV